MDFSNEIAKFTSDVVGGVTIVNEGSGLIVYADKFFKDKYGQDIVDMGQETVFTWIDECPPLEVDGCAEWEYIDIDSKKYYRVYSGKFEKEEKIYSIHQMSDITEYMGLNRDITKYMSYFKRMSEFQNIVLGKLNDTYYELLPVLVQFFKTNKAYCMVEHLGYVNIKTYNKLDKSFNNDRVKLDEEVSKIFEFTSEDDILHEAFPEKIQEAFDATGAVEDSCYRKICSGEVSGQKYAIYVNVWRYMDTDVLHEKSILDVVKLYVENGIMREKLMYDATHDGLTGLFNKAKYLEMADSTYKNMESICIYNMDVNNLKVFNDTMGHEAGDKLLIKAADSIRKVTNEKVHGYRLGGDEYLMIACNVTEEDALKLKEKWEKTLAKLNSVDDGIDCIIAIGMVYGQGDYDYDNMMKEADGLMYEDKKSKKKPGEEIR